MPSNLISCGVIVGVGSFDVDYDGRRLRMARSAKAPSADAGVSGNWAVLRHIDSAGSRRDWECMLCERAPPTGSPSQFFTRQHRGLGF